MKITANVVVHLVLRLARRPADHLVDLGANLEQLPALVPDVRRGPARDARGVVQHDAGVRQRRSLTFGAAREEHATHGSGAAKADASDVGFYVSHGVEDGHGRHDVSSLGVDVQVDVLTALVDAVEVEHGRDELVTELFVDLLADPDDAFAVEAVPDVDPLPGVLVRGLVRDARDSDGHHGGDGSAAFAGPGGHGERGGDLIAEGGDAVARHRQRVSLEAAVGRHGVDLGGGGSARGRSRADAHGQRRGAHHGTRHRCVNPTAQTLFAQMQNPATPAEPSEARAAVLGRKRLSRRKRTKGSEGALTSGGALTERP